MADQIKQDTGKDREGTVGEAFKREGPTPATEDTGKNVEEMNQEAEAALRRNIRPAKPTS